MQTELIGIDVGGTFTDVVGMAADGSVVGAKASTTPGAHVDGIMNALSGLAETTGVELSELLADAGQIAVGTTVVTNAIAEMRGRRTGLLVTKGFRDTLRIARSPRVPTVDPFAQSAMPELVPRALIAEIDERIDAEGDVVVALDEDQVLSEVGRLVEEEGIEALAVCYLWSFLNPSHESRTKELLGREFPDLFLSVSSELYPVVREYERMVTTALNAFVSDVVGSYVEELDARLSSAGFSGRVYLGQSLGGSLEPEEAKRRPLHLFNSGPVGGVIGARRIADAMGLSNILTADMGGTSFDVSLVREGRPDVIHRTVMERFETGMSQVDITVVGSGGGSICWLDERGAPRIGPHSAGAVPGPACYGRGGVEPTVTDVAAVLGLIDPDYFLGGKMSLDLEAAREAIDSRLGSLGGSPEEIGAQMSRIIVSNMLQAVRQVSVQRGRDPRGLTMFAYGGASGLFAAQICRGIGISHLVVPNLAAVFSASGMLAADPIRTEARTVQWSPQSGELATVNTALCEMRGQAVANLADRGFGEDEIELEYVFAMRFAGQTFDVDVTVEPRPLVEEDREALVRLFHERYGELYGAGSVWEDFPVQLMTARVIARGTRTKPAPARIEAGGDLAAARRAGRSVYMPDLEDRVEVDCFEAVRLPIGVAVPGPCIVEDIDTTIFIPSYAEISRDTFGGFEMRIES
ncbi:MAG TPA: hydantoinase/oxoprolinase family protein [Solirubrobacterales bacterium]|nr:hydantoinase/oxoprolinase family protein [Solirubrobacterales bacterium]